ncbi:lactate/malate family dehydrogenase [Streptomyces sp. NPDC001985]|uniref:lactate/malate family dehydrogenase n=1 Tax=Streptomyces sp. NPDC001985 TaxID=3154406 RepID=UPI00333113F3
MKPAKVTIVGAAGGVGASLAHLLLTARDPYEIALIGRSPESIGCLLMDAESLAPLGRAPRVGHGTTGDFHDSDIVVIAASVPLTAWAPRAESTAGNAEIVHPYFREIAKISSEWRGHVIVVTNPIDVFSQWLRRHAQIDRTRILGYSWNDSLRLRVATARVLGATAASTTAWVVGEHGDAFVPLFGRIRVNGRRVHLSAPQRQSVLTSLRGFYAEWSRLDVPRTTAWTTAEGVARMIRDLTRGPSREAHRVSGGPVGWTASMALEGEYGLRDVSVGVPVAMDAEGALSAVEWELEETEAAALRQAAALVRERVAGLGGL